ncbi:hypothetical protein CPB86DRAFT_749202 [Serendipita vermifera]|nr:hypothetical protein CPB86DRAFT_749202 [Serendipita vermifera]
MANLKEFERIFREEVLTKKKKGEDAPTWADVKRLVKQKKIFNETEMQDSSFKSQLKEMATNIALEIMSTTQNDTIDEPRVEHNTKKRKPDSTKEVQSPGPRKKIKKEESKAVQKHRVVESDSDVGDKSPKPGRKSAKAKKILPSASESDTEGPNIPPESPDVRNLDLGKASKAIPAAIVAEMDDSDLSVLEDESPVKNKASKQKGKAKEKDKVKSKKEKDTKPKAKDDKKTESNEEQIKRLKGFVVACGVRKRWNKEFEGMEDQPKKQIAHLKGILEGLGMNGRMSMEKAKAIRAKRELAEELDEVVQFEARRGVGKENEKSKRKGTGKVDPESSEDEETLVSSRPARKLNLLAFLDDQSDED